MKIKFLFLTVSAISSLMHGCEVRHPYIKDDTINKYQISELISRAKQTHTDALVIMHDGKLIAEYYSKSKPTLIHAMSLTKSIVNLAFGLMQTQGLLKSLDTPVYQFYPEWNQSTKKNITIRHLLNHTSGLQDEHSALAVYQSPDFVQFGLAANVVHEPGTHFFYSNKAVNILSGIVKKITGKPLDEYLKINLFQPLGIHTYKWDHDSVGNVHGLAGLHIYPKDLAKIGQLILQKGMWNNKQIISPSWFNSSFTPSTIKPNAGLLWWLIPESITYVIDNQQIEKLRATGHNEEFIKKVMQLKGNYPTEQEYDKKTEEVFGKDFQEIFDKELKEGTELSRKIYGRTRGYKGLGYLGQYLIIYPEKKLVGVRMINESSHTSDQDDFYDFEQMLYKLIQ